VKILFVSSGKNGNKPSPIILAQTFALEKQGVLIEHFTINEKGFKGYIKERKRLIHLLKISNHDLIHAHYGLSGVLCLMAKGKKLVVSFMGDDLVGSNRVDGTVTRVSLILAKINSILASWVYDYSIVKSEQMLTCLSTTRVSIVPNGVDLSFFQPIDKLKARDVLGLCHNDKILIFVSRISRKEKNYKLAQNAVKLIKNFTINLIPVYDVPQSKIPYYYNAADVLLLTSYHEGSPNVIKEAMACNCPIVSTDVGDVKWVLGGTEGCYIASFNPVIYAEKIKLALNFSKEKGRTKGRERIIQLGLDSETVAKKIIDIYEKVLN